VCGVRRQCLEAIENACRFKAAQSELQSIKAPYVIACLMKDVPVEDDLFHYTISAFNAVCTAAMSYHDVAATTKLYGRANSLECVAAAISSPNPDIRTSAVEVLGKLCGSHVGMCQHLKDNDGLGKFMPMLEPSLSPPELRGMVTSLMTMTRRAEIMRNELRYPPLSPRTRQSKHTKRITVRRLNGGDLWVQARGWCGEAVATDPRVYRLSGDREVDMDTQQHVF
jgi:hypothetical protein